MFKQNREFQAGLDTAAVRRQRQNAALSLRRQDRQMKLQKKRKRLLQKTISTNPTQHGGYGTVPQSGDPIYHRQQEMIQNLPKYVEGCFTEHKSTIFECTQKIRELLSLNKEPETPIQHVIDSGVVPRIIQFLRWKQCPELQFEAMWVLTNIASSDRPEFTGKVVRDGAIPAVIEILKSPSYRLQEQAVWALGNIAGDSLELRNLVLSNGAMVWLKALCRQRFDGNVIGNGSGSEKWSGFVSMLRNVSWMMSNLCRFGGHSDSDIIDLVECLAALLTQKEALSEDERHQTPEGIGANIGWSLCYLTNDMKSEQNTVPLLEAMMKWNVIESLIAFLGSSSPWTVHSNLRAIGNVLTANDRYTAHCIDCGVLQRLRVLLQLFYGQNVNDEKLREICWAISNITAGPTAQVIKVVEAQFVPILMAILSGSRTVIAAEALWAVSNATASASNQIIKYLVDHGLVEGLCAFLKKKFAPNSYHRTANTDKLLIATFECIDHILSIDKTLALRLEEYGGLDVIEFLQSDQSVDDRVYQNAARLITKYFEIEHEDDDDLDHDLDIEALNENDNGIDHGIDHGDGAHFHFGLHSESQSTAMPINNKQFDF